MHQCNPIQEDLSFTSDSMRGGLKNASGVNLRCLSYLEGNAIRGDRDLHQLTHTIPDIQACNEIPRRK